MTRFTKPIRYHCEHCGGHAIRARGKLRWSETRQQWEVVNHPDQEEAHCLTCERPTTLEPRPVEDRDLAGMRRALGLSQAELGALMGMGGNEVSRVERGVRAPPKRYRELLEAYAAGYRPGVWPNANEG